MDGFEETTLAAGDADIHVRYGGSGPAVALLHGFPQTSTMWRRVAPLLAEHCTVVAVDLRGYGASSCPPTDPQTHAPYSKRVMAQDVATVMTALGHERFSVVGHDRGGRVAYRMALDHPARVERLAVLDIVPIDTAWENADDRFALGFWPWSLLAQPAPLPERLVGADPAAVLDTALGPAWGTPADVFDASDRAEYLGQLQDPAHLHAICEEYRAAAAIDREHDATDRATGRRITQPTLVLWSGTGPLGSWYAELGGPLALWRELAPDAVGQPVDGGHFFAEEHPVETARALRDFLTGPD